MPSADSAATSSSMIGVDLGTTNTRVWRLASDGAVLAHARAQVGVRDTAREGNSNLLCSTLHNLIAEASAGNPHAPPTKVVAAGMITSALGLMEIPHLPAPAGRADLSAATAAHQFPEITELPIYLVPGVRSGPMHPAPDQIDQTDLMRGEETLCIGLLAKRRIASTTTLLNLGSHWKAIQIDASGRITGSTTSLSGELLFAAQTNTILASAMPPERPASLHLEWVAKGMTQQRKSGLARALFCIRLLQLSNTASATERFSFMAGAFIASDLDALIASGAIARNTPVLIAGNPALAVGWMHALQTSGIDASAITEADCEAAMLAGLTAIVPG